MKTIEQAAREYAERMNTAFEFVEEDFTAGVAFAQRWISVKDELPKENGCYLVKTPDFPKNSDVIVAEFCDDNKTFYSESNDYRVEVTHWRAIELE